MWAKRRPRIWRALYPTIEALAGASAEELEAIHDIGSIVAWSIVDYFADDKKRHQLKDLLACGVVPRGEMKENDEPQGLLSGETIVFTGSLSQDDAKPGQRTGRIFGRGYDRQRKQKDDACCSRRKCGQQIDKSTVFGHTHINRASVFGYDFTALTI